MDDPDQVAKRVRVLWEKGRNMYGSFFTEIEAMRDRREDDAAFDRWMFKQVGVSVSVAIRASNILRAADAQRVQQELRRRNPTTATPPAAAQPAAFEFCLSCGEPLNAQRSTRRYCSDR